MSNRTIDLALEISKLESLAVEGGDLTPEMIADTLEGIEGMLEDKFDAVMAKVREFDTKAEACKKKQHGLAKGKNTGNARFTHSKATYCNVCKPATVPPLKPPSTPSRPAKAA